MTSITEDWHGVYRGSWPRDLLVRRAFGHPAKVTFRLSERIYRMAIEEGWASPGMTVVDPFGGIAGFALHALLNGMNWVGCEIEPRYVALGNGGECDGTIPQKGEKHTGFYLCQGNIIIDQNSEEDPIRTVERDEDIDWDGFETEEDARLASDASDYHDGLKVRQITVYEKGRALCDATEPHEPHHIQGNIELWNEKFNGKTARWGEATLVKGDSRYLRDSLRQACFYPPDGASISVSSPPFIAQSGGTNVTSKSGPLADGALLKRHAAGNVAAKGYGDNLGNIAYMPDEGFSLAVSSPPYADIAQQGGTAGLRKHGTGLTGDGISFSEYGDRSQGNLGAMLNTNFGLAITSPPFEGITANRMSQQLHDSMASGDMVFGPAQLGEGYGETPGNIGESFGEDFWTASRMILEELHAVLKPGAIAIFVCKRYVYQKKLVYFPRKWGKLCVASGFELVKWVRAWQVDSLGSQYDMFGNLIEKKRSRKSFFRYLAESKGSPAIDWEDVICVRKV